MRMYPSVDSLPELALSQAQVRTVRVSLPRPLCGAKPRAKPNSSSFARYEHFMRTLAIVSTMIFVGHKSPCKITDLSEWRYLHARQSCI